MDPAARIDTLPGIPNIKVERENIQGWLKKIRSTKLNPKGKPLMIFRLTDIYKPFVTGETGLRLALIPNAAAAALLAQHPESSLFEHETEAPKPKQAPANVDASEKVS